MKPRPRPSRSAATGLIVLAALVAAVIAPASPAAAQSLSGWKKQGAGGTAPAPARGPYSAPATGTALREPGVFYSNLGLLESMSREAAGAIIDSLKLSPGTSITVLSSTPNEANWFVGNLFAETLASRGYKVRVEDWANPPAAAAPSQPVPAAPARAPASPDTTGGAGVDGPGPDAGTPADSTVFSPDSTGAFPDSTASKSGKRHAGTTPAAPAPADSASGAPAGGAAPNGQHAGKGAAAQPATPANPPPERTHLQPGGSLPKGEVLDLRVVEFGVRYSDIGRKLLFGPVRFTRVGGVSLQVTSLKGPEGDLRQVLSAERHRVDRLSGSQRALAEGASYPFTVPEMKTPGLGRYVEPTVVVGIVASLVYLFYANQSSK